jgi:hypothetical protein
MNTLTLFQAYRKVRNLQGAVISGREKSNVGIAVDSDYLATWWQRLERQARKLERRIVVRLGGDDRDKGYEVCIISGFPTYVCNCRHHREEGER